jgi:hypothetical protein
MFSPQGYLLRKLNTWSSGMTSNWSFRASRLLSLQVVPLSSENINGHAKSLSAVANFQARDQTRMVSWNNEFLFPLIELTRRWVEFERILDRVPYHLSLVKFLVLVSGNPNFWVYRRSTSRPFRVPSFCNKDINTRDWYTAAGSLINFELARSHDLSHPRHSTCRNWWDVKL